MRIAQLAWESASKFCTHGTSGCFNYHRAHALLRQLDLTGGPYDSNDFFLPRIADTLRETGTTVLVSGAADESMAELVLAAGKDPCVTVTDICETPLFLCQELGKQKKTLIKTIKEDFLKYRISKAYKLIVTHAFLGQFSEAERKIVFKNWFDALLPGGRLLTVVRFRPDGEATKVSSDGARILAETAVARMKSMMDNPHVSPDELYRATIAYAATRPPTYPLKSLDQVYQMLRATGFEIAELSVLPMRPQVEGIVGPGVPYGGWRIRIDAWRPME